MRVGDPTHLLVLQCGDRGLPAPVLEHRFCERRWRFDLSWPNSAMTVADTYRGGLAVEIEGGSWTRGKARHTWGTGFEGDCEKYNRAVLMGWRVLRFTPAMVQSGVAIAHIEQALRGTDETMAIG